MTVNYFIRRARARAFELSYIWMAQYRFCPTCGGSLEQRSLKASDPDRLVCAQCGFVFYLDPKVAVGTIIETPDSRLVLVRRAIEPGYGLWVFPGGYVDRGEALTAAAIREAREESGLDIRLDGTHQYLFVFRQLTDHRRLRGVGRGRRAVRRRGVPGGQALRGRYDPVERARLPQYDRGASRLSRWRPARSAAGAPHPEHRPGSMVLRRFATAGCLLY